MVPQRDNCPLVTIGLNDARMLKQVGQAAYISPCARSKPWILTPCLDKQQYTLDGNVA